MTYRKEIEVQFEVSLEPSGWMHDRFPMPSCLAGWLTRNGFSGVVLVTVDALIFGKRGGRHGWDDADDFLVRGARVGATQLPQTVSNCSLSGPWAEELDHLIREAADTACCLI